MNTPLKHHHQAAALPIRCYVIGPTREMLADLQTSVLVKSSAWFGRARPKAPLSNGPESGARIGERAMC